MTDPLPRILDRTEHRRMADIKAKTKRESPTRCVRMGIVVVGCKIFQASPKVPWPGEFLKECADERTAELEARKLQEGRDD